MRILISGGGIAGLTAAYWLEKYGMTPVVIEKAKGVRREGYGIDFDSTGYDVAERMGIAEILHAHAAPLDYLGFVDNKGKLIAKLDVAMMQQQVKGKYLPLMHYTLEQVLYEAICERVEVRFDTSIRSIQQSPARVMVQFENGGAEQFDLLIGADGIHSNVRALVFGPESEYAHYMGYYFASYTLPNQYGIDNGYITYGEPGRQLGVYRNDRPNEIVPLFAWQAEYEGGIPRDRRLPKLRETFKSMGWLAANILADTPASTDIFMDTLTQIRMQGWSRGRVVLIGDACACPTLVSGQGASLAMGGAFVLAEELNRTRDYADAFAYYEHRVRPQTESLQKKAQDVAKSYVPDTALGLAIQHLAIRILFRELFARLLVHQLLGASFLQTEALHRLPESHDTVLGYSVAGKLKPTDYETLRLDVGAHIAKYGQVRLLLDLDGIDGITPGALLDDFEFGRDLHQAIQKLAIVGDSRLATWGTLFAERFYAREVQHFGYAEIKAAWAWLAGDEER